MPKSQKSRSNTKPTQPKDKLLPRLSIAFFDRPLLTGFIWLAVVVFGFFSYTMLLKREGFPSVNIPLALVSGTYASDAAEVDKNVTRPIVDAALQQPNISTVQGSSSNNFFTIQIQYKEGVDAEKAAKDLEQNVKQSGKVPASAHIQYNVPYFGATGGDIQPIDVAVSFYNQNNDVSTEQLTAKSKEASAWLKDKKLSLVKEVFVKDPFQKTDDPSSGQAITIQRNFDSFGIRRQDKTTYYNSVVIGFAKNPGSDVIKLDKEVRDAIDELNKQPQFQGYEGEVSASFAPNIKDNLSELQRVLLEGLLAVLVIGSLVIAIRASVITIISMITVLLTSLGLLYVIGYSLNVITLFALILGLALIVDDTIIMVEAIDAARKRHKDRRVIVLEATRKISRAMVAATATAAVSFAPLLFVGGILGSFIRAIPITIIASLIISLLVALIFIPFFARFILLGDKQLGKMAVKEVAAGFEARLAEFIAKPMLWARNSHKKLFGVGITAVLIGFGFVAAGILISSQVVFNIFPPSKDTNGLALTMNFPPGTTIEQAQTIATEADAIAADTVGSNFEQASYFGSGTAQTAMEQITIISYNKRKVTSPELVKQLQAKYTDFKQAQVIVGQLDLGPPGTVFTVNVLADNREQAFKLANDIQTYLQKAELKRVSGKTAHFTNVTVSNPNQYINTGGKPVVTVSSGFDGDDTTTLVNLAQTAVKNEFNNEKVKSYGLEENTISFELGQESENQDSFKTLLFAFPILLLVMYVLLLIEFQSLLQPLLIFMAIPFSIFGVMLGLYLTNNPISFFAMLGFFALIGLSIKNTILLTDFANQARRSGMGAIDAAVAALEERFRPLFATSATAVVALIPLALSSPFWQGLSVVLIFGLLSSTLLVVTVFPYYYLGAEYLRSRISPKSFALWVIPTIVLSILVSRITNPGVGLLVYPLSLYFVVLYKMYKRRLKATNK